MRQDHREPMWCPTHCIKPCKCERWWTAAQISCIEGHIGLEHGNSLCTIHKPSKQRCPADLPSKTTLARRKSKASIRKRSKKKPSTWHDAYYIYFAICILNYHLRFYSLDSLGILRWMVIIKPKHLLSKEYFIYFSAKQLKPS